jgi:hypothetical protein
MMIASQIFTLALYVAVSYEFDWLGGGLPVIDPPLATFLSPESTPPRTSVIIALGDILDDTTTHVIMIFGFNTDIKHDDTVYHVQSEAREGETLLQTQVFVRGRCIGKHATSYAEQASSQGFTDQQKELMLREQHRQVLDAIREGRLEQVFDKRDNPDALGAIKELDIQWINAESIHTEDQLSMKLRATESGQPVPGARLTVRLARSNAAPFYAQMNTDNSGEAVLVLAVEEGSLSESSVLVQMNARGRTATRKFQLRRVQS